MPSLYIARSLLEPSIICTSGKVLFPYPTPLQSSATSSLPLQNPNPNSVPMDLPSGTQPDAGAKLMALLTDTRPEIWHNRPATSLTPENTSPVLPPGPPMSNLSKGRHLNGDHVVYDVDVRFPGEVQSPLEVTPITKYGANPTLVLGRQIAVNKTYVCYGLKYGAIRVLNISTVMRSLLKGLSQAVRDMAFFSEDVNLLASASADGRVFIWKITAGTNYEGKPEITGKIVMAIQIVGEVEFTHSRVCWHCHKQEVLVVGIGNNVLRINTTKVGKGGVYSEQEPLKCPVDKMIDGVEFVGTHDGEVTDLSMCATCLVSASVDGAIKVWEEGKLLPIAVIRPYDGLPVNSVTFLTSPHEPKHIVLITGGPQNHEMKIWTSKSEDGRLPPSDADSWHCTQTLELKSSAGNRDEDVFFNQVMPVSQAGILLIANAMKNALYTVHLDYGPNPAATRMDYIVEFSVSMPILSLTATSGLVPHGEQIVQAFCVQMNGIEQYSFDLSRCLPPPLENVFERLNPSVSGQEVAEVATSQNCYSSVEC